MHTEPHLIMHFEFRVVSAAQSRLALKVKLIYIYKKKHICFFLFVVFLPHAMRTSQIQANKQTNMQLFVRWKTRWSYCYC